MVSIAGVGIDLIEIARLERALERRPRLEQRLFTDAERGYARARKRPAQHLAARFCAKEAVAKSLGLEGWSFTDVEVLGGTQRGLRLAGRAEEKARLLGVAVQVSLTHGTQSAAAVAVAEQL